MRSRDEVLEIVGNIWRSHVNFLGEEEVAKLTDLIDAGEAVEPEVERAEGGSDFTFAESIVIVWGGIEVVATIVGFYLDLRELMGQAPTQAQLDSKVKDAKIEDKYKKPAIISKINKVSEQVIKKFNKS